MNLILKQIYSSIKGKKKYQGFFENLYHLSLNGMNIGGGDLVTASGEEYAISYINQRSAEHNGLIIFDVGANVGDYTKLLKKILKDKAFIFSFEPSKKTFEELKLNTKDEINIKLYNFGFGNENSKLPLFSDADASGLASLYHRRLDHFNIQMNKTEEIEIKTIDDFCFKNNITHIHFLKIDVEGHEISVLKGAKNMMASKKIDFIQFEFGGCNIDSRTYFQDFFYLLKKEYQIYRIVKDGLYKIEKYKELYEAFATTNYLAERRGIND